MKRSCLAFLPLLLAACVGMPGNVPPVVIYDFGLPAKRLEGSKTWPRLALEVRSPVWFDSLNIDYRLAYEDPLKQREYSGSRWAGAPARLLGQRLRQQFGMVGAPANGTVDCLLRVELLEFSQIFDAPQQSRGVLEASVSLIDAKRRLIDEQRVSIERNAETADAPGGVRALEAASLELGTRVAGWLDDLDQKAALKECRNPRTKAAKTSFR
jgi:ABC-type uncharacterized transport system auxiliary subunit